MHDRRARRVVAALQMRLNSKCGVRDNWRAKRIVVGRVGNHFVRRRAGRRGGRRMIYKVLVVGQRVEKVRILEAVLFVFFVIIIMS